MTRIGTKSAERHVGHVVRMEEDIPCSLSRFAAQLVVGSAMGGLSEIFLPDPNRTVSDDTDNY